MKRLFLIALTVFLNVAFFSCTPLDDEDEYQELVTNQEDCCGEGEIIPPPPPPPPTDGTGG